ncbi:thermonuclease family protein [Candidatus Woesearchaeota archaeon]|nr:thermonuclease family protein [Candidatus Woesearchaeota archaeon]
MLQKILFIFVLVFFTACAANSQIQGPFIVTKVLDGDTLDVNMGRIRLAGINTPELGTCFSSEARDALANLTLGKEIYLERDQKDKEKYGRFLRYVYVNNLSVNDYLVHYGYAVVFDYYNSTTNRYQELKDLEAEAKAAHLGVWTCPEQNCLYVASKNSKIYHRPDCPTARKIKSENLLCFHSEEELAGYTPGKSC